MSLAGISESHITGCDVTRVEDAVVIHSGGTQQINGVALVLSGPFRESLVSWSTWTPVSDRILHARIAHRHGHLTVVVVYAPTEITSDSIRQRLQPTICHYPVDITS